MSYSSGLSIIISSPSGAGKTTITRAILKKIKKSHLSISCTTRKPRSNERDGVDYFFVSKEKFINLKKRKKFLEYAKVYENYYGTLKSEVENNLKKKNLVLFDVDWKGARSIKNKINKNCYSFFILPPNKLALRQRLLKRHKEDKHIALKRFSLAKKDIEHWGEYDFIFINDNLNKCVKSILKKIRSLIEEKKRMDQILKIIKKL